MKEVHIHGTYPFDDRTQRWDSIRDLTAEEAAVITGASLEKLTKDAFGGVYLWLNKGYVVIGSAEPGINGLIAGMLEERLGSARRSWPVGTQAVYLADGLYMLIERVAR